MTALRGAGWGLTAGLMLAAPALAQYGAHTPGQSPSGYPRTISIQQVQPATGSALPIPPGPKPDYATLDCAKNEVVPVSHTTTVTTVTGLPAGYVLQSVDGKPVTMPVLDSHTKLEEMRIELALMADPATFACNLTARLNGKAMMVNGYVPNDAVREKAIQIARTGTHLIVADGLRIHPTLAMRSAGVPKEQLEQGAMELLSEAFPEIAPALEIKVTITGQIKLTGSARSFEEKLNVSNRLRRLSGCTSVVNELKVTPLMKDGVSLSMVLADGSCFVPTEFADSPAGIMMQAIPAVPAKAPVQGTLAVNTTVGSLPPLPPTPPAMQSPTTRRAATPAKPTRGVSQGTVRFED
jgi:hypothetical protein